MSINSKSWLARNKAGDTNLCNSNRNAQKLSCILNAQFLREGIPATSSLPPQTGVPSVVIYILALAAYAL